MNNQNISPTFHKEGAGGGIKKDRKFYNQKLHALSHTIAGSSDLLKEEIRQILISRPPTVSEMVAVAIGVKDMNHPLLTKEGEGGGSLSVKNLTDAEAIALYDKLLPLAKSTAKSINKLKLDAGIKAGAKMSEGQRNGLIKILKYNLKWSAQASFEFIVTAFPEYRKRLTPNEIALYDLFALYGLIEFRHADKLIKRLDKIQMGKKTAKKNCL